MSHSQTTFAPFKHRDFRVLWSATLISNLGGLVQGVGAGWMMTTMTDSHNMVALVQAATTLPIMIFSIAAGALADNFNRRSILIVAQSLMMLASLALAILTFFGLLSPWLLLAFTFLIGCGTALHNPSWQASMGDLVPRSELSSAVTLNSMGFNLMRSVGPAIGGIVVAVAGAFSAFLLNAVSYVALIWALFRWKPVYATQSLPRERFGSAMTAGLRYVFMSPKLLAVLLRSSVFGLCAISIMALLPSITSTYLEGGALSYGTMLGCFGLGAIIGAVLNARIRAHLPNEMIVRFTCLGFAVCCMVLGLSRDTLLSHMALIPAGMCWVLTLSLFNVSIQLSSPRWVVGRAMSIYQTATFGGMALGSWTWGLAADAFGPAFALAVAGLGLVICAGIGLVRRLPDFESANLDPVDGPKVPDIRLNLRPRSGPILVVIDYIIGEEDIPAFLALMAERRRIRLRNGASHWVLLRDLEHPDVWSESFHVATWVDYIRHQQRRTQADAENFKRIRSLHRGTDLPRVSRKIERQTVPVREDLALREHHVDLH